MISNEIHVKWWSTFDANDNASARRSFCTFFIHLGEEYKVDSQKQGQLMLINIHLTVSHLNISSYLFNLPLIHFMH